MRRGRVEVALSPRELERLDRVAAERGTNRSEVVREAVAPLGGRPARMTAADVLGLLEGHARRGSLKALTLLARAHGLHRGLAQGRPRLAPTDAFMEFDALADRRHRSAEDDGWVLDADSAEPHRELARRRGIGPGAE